MNLKVSNLGYRVYLLQFWRWISWRFHFICYIKNINIYCLIWRFCSWVISLDSVLLKTRLGNQIASSSSLLNALEDSCSFRFQNSSLKNHNLPWTENLTKLCRPKNDWVKHEFSNCTALIPKVYKYTLSFNCLKTLGLINSKLVSSN